MIPKQLFFIWLGDNKPDYVDFAINAFKEVNPDFKVDLIWFNDKDVEESTNHSGQISNILPEKSINNCLELSKNTSYVDRYKSSLSVYKIKLSLSLRYFYLNNYGGIYLDCDTFPIKPFDDELLKNDFFLPLLKDNQPDSFFIGKIKNSKDKYTLLKTSSMFFSNLQKNPIYMNLCRKFYSCELKIGEAFNNRDEHYIDHYWIREFKYYDT